MHQSVSQSINQSVNQSISQSGEAVSLLTDSQSLNPHIKQSFSPSSKFSQSAIQDSFLSTSLPEQGSFSSFIQIHGEVACQVGGTVKQSVTDRSIFQY